MNKKEVNFYLKEKNDKIDKEIKKAVTTNLREERIIIRKNGCANKEIG